jgi:hypothetical protein
MSPDDGSQCWVERVWNEARQRGRGGPGGHSSTAVLVNKASIVNLLDLRHAFPETALAAEIGTMLDTIYASEVADPYDDTDPTVAAAAAAFLASIKPTLSADATAFESGSVATARSVGALGSMLENPASHALAFVLDGAIKARRAYLGTTQGVSAGETAESDLLGIITDGAFDLMHTRDGDSRGLTLGELLEGIWREHPDAPLSQSPLYLSAIAAQTHILRTAPSLADSLAATGTHGHVLHARRKVARFYKATRDRDGIDQLPDILLRRMATVQIPTVTRSAGLLARTNYIFAETARMRDARAYAQLLGQYRRADV